MIWLTQAPLFNKDGGILNIDKPGFLQKLGFLISINNLAFVHK